MTTQPYPLDFAALEKDQLLDETLLSSIFGFEPTHEQWRLKVMQLRYQIEEMRRDLLVKHEGTGLRIMTDEFADPYLNKQLEFGVRMTMRSSQRRARIDRTGFTAEQRRAAESRDRIATRTALSAHQSMRNQILLERLSPKAGSLKAGDEGQ